MPDRSDDGAGTPDTSPPEAGSDVIAHVTAFVRDLRAEGVDVPANAGIDAARAIRTVGLGDRDRTKAALRATLVSRQQDIETFDRLFPAFWERLIERFDDPREHEQRTVLEDHASRSLDPGEQAVDAPPPGGRNADTTGPDPATGPGSNGEEADPASDSTGRTESSAGGSGPDREDASGAAVDVSTYSRVGTPAPVDVPRVSDDGGLTEAVDELTRALGDLKGRRWAPTAGGTRIDARKALRRSVGRGGTVPDIPMRARRRSAVRAVVMVDVSQSVLDTIDRGFLLRFLWLIHDAWRSVRIFFFDTDVREVTDRFAVPTTEDALAALQRAEAEWGGGTRIGNAFATVRAEYPYAIDRETTVVVISDGLEVDEVDQLQEEMAAVSRQSNAVLWLNPLAASADYQPTCRGMAASLPYVDGLFAFADGADVAEIARQLRLRGIGGSIGYEYDQRDRVP